MNMGRTKCFLFSVASGVLLLLWLLILIGATCGPARADQPQPSIQVNSASATAELRVCQTGCTYSSIQAAVDAARAGDIIKVARGIYMDIHVRDAITQVVYISKTVTIRGGYDSGNWDTPNGTANPTTLDARGLGRAIYIIGYITPTIEGLRITGGDATLFGPGYYDRLGGGIFVLDAAVVVSGNVIYSNNAIAGGGVALRQAGGSTFSSNTVYSNTAVDGAGVYVESGDVELNANRVWGNVALQQGGGIRLAYASGTCSSNIIYGNRAAYGGGLYLRRSSSQLVNTVVIDNVVAGADALGSGMALYWSAPRLVHTTVARNSGGDGSAIHLIEGEASDAVFVNTIISGHTAGIKASTGTSVTLNATLWYANDVDYGGPGTINRTNDHSGAPAFDADGYHLTSASAAVDIGVDAGVASDVDGELRPASAGYDIGADELRVRFCYLPVVMKNRR